jgi:hypothetical protein
MAKFEKPFSDWPVTTVMKDGGVRITGKYIHPMVEPRFRTLMIFLGFASLIPASAAGPVGLVLPLLIAVFYPAYWRNAGAALMGRRLDIRIYPDKIRLPSGFGYKNYARAAPIEFRVDHHMKGIQKPHLTRFREAVEVVMQYGDRRIPLADFPMTELETANTLVLRLQAVCYSFDAAMEMAGRGKPGAAHAGAGEFGPAPDIR